MKKLVEALRAIARWDLPICDEKHTNGSPMSFGTAHGSNGEREHIRSVARHALLSSAVAERRELIAVAALQGILSNADWTRRLRDDATEDPMDTFAFDACWAADALIAELDKPVDA